MSREISWVRPPILPFTDSRSLRVRVARGSIAYSAVTQPRPLPLRHRGTPCWTDAAQRTFVSPNSIRAEPSAYACQLRVMVTGRSWSLARPSGRGIFRPYLRGPTRLRGAPGRPALPRPGRDRDTGLVHPARSDGPTDASGVSVADAARRIGVATSTLRTWERRYGLRP